MGKKIFISYKYADASVASLTGVPLVQKTEARHYVDHLQELLKDNHINKGELDDEDLSRFKDNTIESKLKDRIYDSSLTIVLISKNMKDATKVEGDQWIPWEISYSLREKTRNERTSLPNAFLAIILPDESGSYKYMVENISDTCECLNFKNEILFEILGQNMFNRKVKLSRQCPNGAHTGIVHYLDNHSYIFPVRWSDFINESNKYINIAFENNKNIFDFDLSKIST